MAVTQNFYSMVNKKINEMTDEKVVARSKKTPTPVKRQVVERECEEVYFKELGKELDNELKNFNAFYEQLHHDDPDLYSKVRGRIVSTLKSANVDSIDDLLRISTQKPDQKILTELKEVGLGAFEHKEFERAFLYFSYLALVDSDNPQFWLLKAMAAHNDGKINDALKCYEYSIALAPHYLLAYIHLMNCQVLAKQFDKAKHTYDDFQRQFDHKEYDNISFVVSNLKNIKEALAQR